MNNISWISSELSDVDFSDKRLTNRVQKLAKGFFMNPSSSIPASCKGWHETKSAYRFFDNKKVTADKILSCHKSCTVTRISQEPVVLALQDTTEVIYKQPDSIEGLGSLYSSKDQGFRLHPTIAFTGDKVCLGVLDAKFMVRESLGQQGRRASKSIEEKESYRWLQSYQLTNSVAAKCPNTTIINIGDREGDIYELFLESTKPSSKAHLLIRSQHDRALSNGYRLFTAAEDFKIYGKCCFEFKSGNKKRKVRQEIRSSRITLLAPEDKKCFPPVEVRAIYCKEDNPPSGQKAIKWLFLTTIDQEFDIKTLISFYLSRWEIELFFKVLKSGCKIEELQLDHFDRLSSCIALYMIISWRILLLRTLYKAKRDIPAGNIFEECEWRTTYIMFYRKPPPSRIPNSKDIIVAIASFGGFLGRKGDNPGIKTIWIGLNRMYKYVEASENVRVGGTYG